ncbi:ABC-type sugar transport system permease subunit [Saccharothrix tamanrassetensis]|uniref:ABC-type sugar transport system permease subunit n=1 Tax=Saccharothrix tamanrassetensis TaxID=1051531 RepID=A0A841CMQ5_9PSEU|nr:sugar ABC transporter permease [Saccharothrix tamanrassetensis]MBB5959752.1 ABC-type sugar transport system permease subunit [Saccharothrix tamanrassetensis]
MTSRPGRRGRASRTLTAYAFLAPSLAVIGLFTVWPLILAAGSSVRAARPGSGEWVGADNYVAVLNSEEFRNALGNTAVYVVLATPVTVACALGLALLLNRKLAGRTFFRAAVFVPAVVSLGVTAISWRFLLSPEIGLVTHWLHRLGIPAGNGIRDPDLGLAYLAVVHVWRNVGFYAVMYLAGLNTIPRTYYESAHLDGANAWQRFRHITWPLLGNTTAFVSILAVVTAVQAFDHVFVMTGGGPYSSTETLVYLLYRKGFEDLEFGYAATLGWIVLLMVFALSLAQNLYFSRRVVGY